jgi:hypothetical protein
MGARRVLGQIDRRVESQQTSACCDFTLTLRLAAEENAGIPWKI